MMPSSTGPRSALPRKRAPSVLGDRALALASAAAGLALVLALMFVVATLTEGGARAILSGHAPRLDTGVGAERYLLGTVVTTLGALALAAPIALGTALFDVELAPPWAKRPLSRLLDAAAAVPAVVYGLFGLDVLVPGLRWLGDPILGPGAPASAGVGLLTASFLLATMIFPTVTRVARAVLATVPDTLREAGAALGATRTEVVALVVVPHAWRGLLGALLLGAGRAAGEAVAVGLVAGGRPNVSGSPLGPGETAATVVLEGRFGAESPAPLFALALALLGIALATSSLGRILVARSARRSGAQDLTAAEVA